MNYTKYVTTQEKSTEPELVDNDAPMVMRNYKDTVFRMLFREKRALLSLYNAVNKTNFTNVDEFYNGSTQIPERTEYRLSDLFQKKTDYPELELIVTVYNINPGMNEDLLEACHLLKEYMLFTTKIRENRKTMDLRLAVNKAVEDCIRKRILAEFLKAQRAEVIAMSIFEYDQEKHMKFIKEEGREEGRHEGQERLLTLLQYMENNNEFHLISKLHDEEFLKEMYQKYQL